jgi:hypothetical protein
MEWYRNPIQKHGDFADPFVLRHNGAYYLYCTNPDLRCWSSRDLVNWHAEGPAILPGTFPGLVPFAPEAVYWNGAFYMYTSPSGFGHYLLKSGSPTGPFEKISGNIGHSIDGSVFIDDDGQWYFYWADDSGILACRMDSPTEFSEPVHTGAFMNGWTEGPFVVKHNSLYYMTYTGNHYLSRGYRINAAVSENPMSGFKDYTNNPLLVHTEGTGVGLGHSSTVLGPDLLTRYIVYHNINPDATRDLNIDAVALDEGGMHVYGPTRDRQPAPRMPNFQDFFDSDQTLENWDVTQGHWERKDGCFTTYEGSFRCAGKEALDGSGAVECNIRANGSSSGDYGIWFGSSGDLLRFTLNPSSNLARITDAQGSCLASARLPCGFAHGALHCLQVRWAWNGTCVLADGKKQLEISRAVWAGSRFGYYSDGSSISIGYTAYSSGTEAEAIKRLYKPVPGIMPLHGSGRVEERVNVAKTARYVIAALCNEPLAPGQAWSLCVNGLAAEVETRIHEGSRVAELAAVLPEGPHKLSVQPPADSVEIARIEAFEPCPILDAMVEVGAFGPYGKVLVGEDGMCDYCAEADIHALPQERGGAAGLLFRLTEPAEGGEGENRALGVNFFKGYCISLSEGSVVLTKHAYDETVLAKAEAGEAAGQLRVEAVADRIDVFVNGSRQPILSYRDENPYLHGRVGIRARGCIVERAVLRIAEL